MKVLIADDEPHYLDWIEDYLATKGVETDYATTVEAAVEKLTTFPYRFVLVDLNIPLSGDFTGEIATSEPFFRQFPGLYIAYVARNSEYRSRQVIVYSVHLEEVVRDYVDRIRCQHIPKGWARDLMRENDAILEFDPGAS